MIPSVSLFIFIAFSLTISIFASHKTTLPIHDKCHHVAVCKRQNKRPSGPEQLAAVYTYTKEKPKKNKEAGYGCIICISLETTIFKKVQIESMHHSQAQVCVF